MKTGTLSRLLGATAISFWAPVALAQDVTTIPVGANTEAPTPTFSPEGFVISVNGDAILGDRAVQDVVRRTDVQLANADVQVTFDGLGADPRLDVEIVGDAPRRAGEQLTLQSATNYPAFVSRAEMRIIDRAATGGPRTIGVYDMSPNGQLSIPLPEGNDLIVVHRVYGTDGRFDETAPLRLTVDDARRRIDGVEDGADSAVVRNIDVTGGAVTVRGSDVAPGATVTALGERISTDRDGGFIIQRILSAGDYGVDVRVQGGGQNVDLTRDITIPRAEWFYVATADLTYGIREGDSFDGRETYTTGRFAGFVNGKTAEGVRIIGSLDTGEGDLEDIFRDLDKRDPRQLLLRVDPDDLYPTYGDDSTSEDLTPTEGRIFLRIEKDRNFVQWGNFKGDLSDNAFVRNERSLYGLSAGVETRAATSRGDAMGRFAFYAAQPERSPHRDVFLGTGGSVFFLEKQDIAQASETISIQLRDPDTGRVTQTRQLVAGQDYQINYIQGIVTLSQPLQASASEGLFDIGSASKHDVVLVAAYEHTPSASDVDGFAYGARAEGWLTDNIRVGVSGMLDETGDTDHQVVGLDVMYQISDDSFLRLDYAESEGTGFDSTFSADGGLIVDTITATGSSGEAFKLEGKLNLSDLGVAADGAIGAYFERRSEGFASLDTQVTAATGDELFWGLAADVKVSDQWTLGVGYDAYENDAGETDTTGTVAASYQATAQLNYAIGLETQDNTGGTRPGSRTDLAARLTYTPDDAIAAYVFGQTTLDRDTLPANDRFGVGGSYAFGNGWQVGGEVSDGSLGIGGRVTAAYADGNGNTRYVSYEVDPDRELDGINLSGRDRGRFVAGGSQRISSTIDVFGENTYDLFGVHDSLISAYGLTYTPTDTLSFTGALEIGRVDDGDQYDLDRRALSLGMIYSDAQLDASGRVEYRTEDGLNAGNDVTADTLLVSANAAYKFDEVQRLVFSADIARTKTEQSNLIEGDYADVVLGYAYRPIEDDRLNILARYRFLSDTQGLRDAEEDGPRQRSQVVSVDASYDLNPQWTIGGKLGYRSAETAIDSDSDFAQNDAWLAVANARYHLVHDWDALLEVRQLNLVQAETSETSFLGAVYKHINNNVKVGVGYNFGSFSDDLTDLTQDDQGAFVNVIAKF
ncbi:hypothetical protein SAMN04488515_0191 [Cognatiyoonia koreensis]|uniref:TonB-dependent receptor n=1 Tax=Cognatiyoonia koreensis TaxID=364200 RepID=A0A1I0MS48_9RHOB|nr:hypothetical protein [Cognatiyoonia koreensis]SEV91196.1 hypothetical protein SAMN04488515_0191 [Cognatiyoonia koreensis]